MVKFEGFATMYMRMPMSSSTLPIEGTCTVEDKKISLSFPFTGIAFELPTTPSEGSNDFDFKIRGARGDLAMTVSYIKELKCFKGSGIEEGDDKPVVTFTFFPHDSPMAKLK